MKLNRLVSFSTVAVSLFIDDYVGFGDNDDECGDNDGCDDSVDDGFGDNDVKEEEGMGNS